MSDLCKWLNEQLRVLPLIKFPFVAEHLPQNGIYFFYEVGETWGHGGEELRITRIGTSIDGNFRNRLAEHYLLNESKMDFDATRPAPHERSIFRKNIGRALLNRDRDAYLQVWEIDFTTKKNRELYANLRDIQKEREIELSITELIRQAFCFRFIIMENRKERMGKRGIESSLIGTIAQCLLCRPSARWLGNCSPDKRIRESGLWLVQHLKARPLDGTDKETISQAIRRTQQWIKLHREESDEAVA
jgi:hypothetical protein